MADPTSSGPGTKAYEKGPDEEGFNDFSERLDQARASHEPPQGHQQRQGAAMGMGLKLASELIAALIVGGVLGFGADMVFGTKPLFILMGLALGCAAAFMNVLRMMKKLADAQTGENDPLSESAHSDKRPPN